MFRKLFVFLAVTIAICALGVASANASTVCGEDCTTIPAIKSERVEQTTTEQVTERTIKSKKVTAKIRHYERVRNVRVAVHMRAGGVRSTRGCVDPIRKNWIDAGDLFTNTRLNGSPFPDEWERGRRICDPRRVRIGNRWFMQGTKDNCDNRGIRIKIRGPSIRYQYKKVVEFKSYKEFLKVYTKWTKRSTIRTTTPTVNVTYSCPIGWTPVDGGINCRKCEPRICEEQQPRKDGTQTPPPPPVAPGPNPAPSPEDPTVTPENPRGGWACYDEETGDPVNPLPDGRCPEGSWGEPTSAA